MGLSVMTERAARSETTVESRPRHSLRARLKYFVLWSYEDKGVFLAIFASVGVLLILGGLVAAHTWQATALYFDHVELARAIRVVAMFSLGSLVMGGYFFLYLWRRDRSAAQINGFLHFALFVFVAEMFYVVYTIGYLSAGILVVVTTVCITRFAFDRNLGGFVLLLSYTGILGLTVLQSLGILRYGPVFLANPGAMFRHSIVLWTACAAVLTVLSLLYGMLDFIAARMHEMSTTDGLTHIANRLHFMAVFRGEYQRAARNGRSLSFLLIDVDHFKRVNDTFGHLVGDDVLCAIASLVQKELRAYDLVGRFGGEEFSVLLPEADLPSALQIAERCRKRIESTEMGLGDAQVGVTISIGIACMPVSVPASIDEFTLLADKALYRAKNEGRNRVVAA